MSNGTRFSLLVLLLREYLKYNVLYELEYVGYAKGVNKDERMLILVGYTINNTNFCIIVEKLKIEIKWTKYDEHQARKNIEL